VPKSEDQEDKIPNRENKQTPATPPASGDNPFGLSFVVPTEFVELPSRGEFYPTSHPMHGISELEIKYMTAREEDILSTPLKGDEELLFDKLANSLIVRDDIKAEDLLEDDKMMILLRARVTGYGEEYKTTTSCYNCGKVHKVGFDLTNTTILEPKNSVYDPKTDSFELTLPVTKVVVRLKNVTDEDEKTLAKEKSQKEKLNLDFSPSESFLNLVILTANKVTDRKLIRSLVEVLPAGDVKSIRSFYSSCQPKLSLKQEITCPNCGDVSEKEAPLSWAFFRADV
tara:strand:+ start:14963 stop:15814 length:852 start_codon:yes stop_codon:yes gene_type:complete